MRRIPKLFFINEANYYKIIKLSESLRWFWLDLLIDEPLGSLEVFSLNLRSAIATSQQL